MRSLRLSRRVGMRGRRLGGGRLRRCEKRRCDDTFMPIGVADDDGAAVGCVVACGFDLLFGLLDDFAFGFFAFLVFLGEEVGDVFCLIALCDGEEEDGVACVAHAAAGVEAWAEDEADVVCVDFFVA